MGVFFVFISNFLLIDNVFSLPFNNKEIIQQCDEDGSSCDVYIYNKNVVEKKILKNYPYESKIKQLESGKILIISSCGSPCSSYMFVNLENNQVELYGNPIVFNENEGFLVLLDKKDINLKIPFENKLITYSIHDLARTASPTSAIEKIEFYEKTRIRIHYLNKDFESRTIEFKYNF